MKIAFLGWLAPALMVSLASASDNGRTGYSGNPATNNGRTCNTCHSGGTQPTVTLQGPSVVEKGLTYRFTLLIQGGQVSAAGLDVSATQGTFLKVDSDTKVQNGEITHASPRKVDANGDVLYQFDWTAPMTTGVETMYAAGLSVNSNGGKSGDMDGVVQQSVTVVDCLVQFRQYGAGTPGSGGFVPDLDGTDGDCSGGYTLDFSNGLGGGSGLLLISGSPASIPFACGNLLVDPTDPLYLFRLIRLGGPRGVPGAGALSIPGPDLSAFQGLDLYLQGLFFDPMGCQKAALSNGVLMDIG